MLCGGKVQPDAGGCNGVRCERRLSELKCIFISVKMFGCKYMRVEEADGTKHALSLMVRKECQSKQCSLFVI